ncbi:hypothetical protein [Candidatus Vidania fulgoroideorum]
MNLKTLNNYILVKKIKNKKRIIYKKKSKNLGIICYINKKLKNKYKINKGFYIYFKKFLKIKIKGFKNYVCVKITNIILYWK